MNPGPCPQCAAPGGEGFIFCRNCGATLQPIVSSSPAVAEARERIRPTQEGIISLGINDAIPVGALAPEVPHKSAGLAFLFSLILPGAGQFYCGKGTRGSITLAFWLFGLTLCFMSRQPDYQGSGLLLLVVLWTFSFLDAYFTAIEINSRQDSQVDVQNPRVAVTLNLLTAGFGYFYLGERTKGIVILVGTQIVRFGVPRITGFAGGVVSLALIVVQMVMAADAYRLARLQLKEALDPQPEQPSGADTVASRLPVFVPVGLACLAGAGFIALVIFGLALHAARGGAGHGLSARSTISGHPDHSQSPFGGSPSQNTPVGPPTDLLSAVNDIQRLEGKTDRSQDDIQELKGDVQIFGSLLRGRNLNRDDAVVVHFYKAEAFRLINSIHYQDGEPVEPAAAREAISDFDAVITSNVNTYVPAVNVSNAEYYAGVVARDHLQSFSLTYKYWERCAWQGHAGCLNVMAHARLTGDGGQKVDINEALDLHRLVFNTGVRFRCAGASSALNIAEIVYFTGVHRAGDDELEWVNKSYGLMDRLQLAESKDACNRAHAQVEEFLFQLSRGKRKPNILQDAAQRLNGESPTLALIQMFSGSIDKTEFNTTIQSTKSGRDRCTAYFDAMWYSQLMKETAAARQYHQRLLDIGPFQCGDELTYARKFKL